MRDSKPERKKPKEKERVWKKLRLKPLQMMRKKMNNQLNYSSTWWR
jgi:hypothetical protein